MVRWALLTLAVLVLAVCSEPSTTTATTARLFTGLTSSTLTVTGNGSSPSTSSRSEPLADDIDAMIQLPADRFPTDAAFAGERFWVIAVESPPESGQRPATDAYVMSVDAETGAVDIEVMLGDAPVQLVADERAVWVTHWETGAVSRLDPETGEVIATIPLELPFDFGGNQDNFLFIPYDIVIGHGSVWVSTARGAVARIDQPSAELQEMHDMPGNVLIGGLEVGPEGVWVEADAGGLVHISADTGDFSAITRESLGHRGWSVFVPGGEIGDGVYVSGSDENDTYVTSRIDPETFDVLGSTEFDEQIIHLGWVNAFVGALDDRGVFTHLSSIPRLGSQVNHTTWSGGYVFETFREAWEIDTGGNRLVRIDETGAATVELPFEIDDAAGGRRTVPEGLALSADWEARAPAPIPHRWPAVVAWTGEEIVIWGGESLGGISAVGGGAAYNVEADTWREMGDSPLRGMREAGWVWTGDELVIWTDPDSAAAWQPASNTWRVIDEWPLDASFYRSAVWTGTEILSTGGFALDPSTGNTRPIADPPAFHERSSVVWVDGFMVSVTSDGAYRVADDEWIEMPVNPLTPLATSGVAVDDELVAVDYEMNAAEYDPGANAWSDLPDLPLRFSECAPNVQVFREQAVVDHCAGLAFWDEADSMWMPVTHPEPTPEFVPTIIAAGDRLFAWGDALYEFAGDPEQPSRLAVGTSVLDVPEGWWVTSVSADGDSMQVLLESGRGDTCAITAIHAGADGVLQSYVTDEAIATQIRPHVGGEPQDALVLNAGEIDDRYHLVWATSTTDVIDLACSGQPGAEEVAPRVWSPYQ